MSGFCKQCGNLYDITQNIKLFKTPQKGGRSVYEKIDSILEKISQGETIDESDLKNIKYNDINSYNRFNTLSRKKQSDILSKIKKIIPGFERDVVQEDDNVDQTPYYICYQCYFYESIQPGETIYSISLTGDEQQQKEDFSHLIHDPTFLRTNVYICPNKNCETHKKPELRKAIMLHTPQYNMRYVCHICYSSWLSG